MVVLGSTGSIGVNTLIIASRFNIPIEVLVAGRNIALLNQQIAKFQPKVVVIANDVDREKVHHSQVYSGEEGIVRALAESQSDLVVNALVGFIGLKPTIEALRLKKRLALANKESLVVAGAFIDTSSIIPIDSEHFGLWYLDQARPIERMLITASGGSFRDWRIQDIQNATLKETLNHPNWSMGTKITIDSASMTNKLFELLEARWLFPQINQFDAFIETKSIIHALIDYKDGSTTAHFAKANMQLPIAYAIMGHVNENILEPVNFLSLKSLEFREIKSDRYPIWEVKDILLKTPKLGVIINAANEKAIEYFLKEKIRFVDIAKASIKALEYFDTQLPQSIDDVFILDKEVRSYIKKELG
jgi:1-deoxy-D-xylulose-5-phosphate reductoisomerase